jgi:hypothetical protein
MIYLLHMLIFGGGGFVDGSFRPAFPNGTSLFLAYDEKPGLISSVIIKAA